MRQLSKNATFGLTVLLASTLVFFVMIGLLAYGIHQLVAQPATAVNQTALQFTKAVTPIAPLKPVALVAPAENDQVVTATASKATTSSTPTTENESAPNYYAADMTAAGISASDQPIVNELLLNGPLWKSGGAMGIRVASEGTSAVARFELVTEYVTSRYGSWQGALTQAQNNGGAW